MADVVAGFATIISLIALGFLLAHARLVDETAQHVLTTVSYYVATPALMVIVMARSDATGAFSRSLVSAAGIGATLLIVVPVGRWWLHARGSALVVAGLSAVYANAAMLGLPIAASVLGDPALIAPILLLQLVVLQPVAVVLLSAGGSASRSDTGKLILRALVAPVTVATCLGIGLSVTATPIPPLIGEPLGLVGAMAVPAVLLAYGVSLRVGPRPLGEVSKRLMTCVVVGKLAVYPAMAWAIGRFVLGMSSAELLAVTVLSALPTAHNVFMLADHFRVSSTLARDAVFVTTLIALPVITLVVGVLA